MFFIDAQEQLMDVYDRLDDLSADTAEARAANILHGLGFTKEMQQQATKDFSGGTLSSLMSWFYKYMFLHSYTINATSGCLIANYDHFQATLDRWGNSK